jgi:predicted flavoprotein YhiN
VVGKGVFKDEFVTCGGIPLNEVDFKTMESRICPGLYFAGEILDIDGITGGFNFQNAWTTGFIAGEALT